MFWDSDFNRWQDEVQDLFSGIAGAVHEYPAVNVWTNQGDALVTAELPGMEPSELDIAVRGSTVTLRGTRAPEQLKESDSYLRQERVQGEFVRALELPFNVDAAQVSARMNQGVLYLTLPRAAEDKPRKIAIKAA